MCRVIKIDKITLLRVAPACIGHMVGYGVLDVNQNYVKDRRHDLTLKLAIVYVTF